MGIHPETYVLHGSCRWRPAISWLNRGLKIANRGIQHMLHSLAKQLLGALVGLFHSAVELPHIGADIIQLLVLPAEGKSNASEDSRKHWFHMN